MCIQKFSITHTYTCTRTHTYTYTKLNVSIRAQDCSNSKRRLQKIVFSKMQQRTLLQWSRHLTN